MDHVNVYRDDTNLVYVSLGRDVSGDAFISEIRDNQEVTSDVIAVWNIVFKNDGTDGELILTLDDDVTIGIEKTSGYMDIKQVSDGESVLDSVIPVIFKNTIPL